ncbi:MAG: protein-glutamate O-methyltransferase CheR [Myxococcales bacterium]|nr:protein-glutamate O-methyltransferase CheR [Myxococcales bacterium]
MSNAQTAVNDSELLDDEELSIVQDVARRYFGFDLAANKRTMLTRRMRLFAQSQGKSSAGQVVRTSLVEPTKEVLLELAVYLTTNHTFFHRESQHFERLIDVVIPEVRKQLGRGGELRLWCAAASTGQEPYELAMCLEEALGRAPQDWERAVLATDISDKVLEVARLGNYDGEQVATLPGGRLRDFMVQEKNSTFSVAPRIRNLVTFRRLNLMRATYPFRRPFQIVFCRNVMIYFSASVRREVLSKLAGALMPGGYLFIGRSESARGMEETLRFVEPGLYRKVGN